MGSNQMLQRKIAFEALEPRVLFTAADGGPTILTFGNFHPTWVQLPLGITVSAEGNLLGTEFGKNLNAQIGTFNFGIGLLGQYTGNLTTFPVEVAISVCWGDGTTSGGGVESITLGNGEIVTGVTSSHTFSRAGIFNVSVFCGEITEEGVEISGQCNTVVDVTPSASAVYHAPVSSPGLAAAPSGGGSTVGQNVLQSNSADQILA